MEMSECFFGSGWRCKFDEFGGGVCLIVIFVLLYIGFYINDLFLYILWLFVLNILCKCGFSVFVKV